MTQYLQNWKAAKANGVTRASFAANVGLTPKQLDNKLYREKQGLEYATSLPIIPYDLGEPLELAGDWMIVGDVHVPTTDWSLAGAVADVAKKRMRPGNRRLIVAGDLFNMDSFSYYQAITRLPTWHDERDSANYLINKWLDTFDEITILLGNHDRRLQKWLNGVIDASDILALLTTDRTRVQMSNWGWCWISTELGPYVVVHPKNYSRNQLIVGSEIAEKMQANYIGFHEHHLAKGWSRYGNYVVVNGGGLFDEKNMAYVQLDLNKSPKMQPGFVLLQGGATELFGREPFTDWSKYLDRTEDPEQGRPTKENKTEQEEAGSILSRLLRRLD